MTLILSFVCPQYALQVSDRLTTRFDTGEVVSSSAIKMVQYCNQMIFGFTGLAHLPVHSVGFLSTDQWLANTINACPNADLEEACARIAHEAGIAVGGLIRQYDRVNLRLAFVGTGYWPNGSGNSYLPATVLISNFHYNGVQQPLPSWTFSIYKTNLDPTQYTYVDYGASIGNKLQELIQQAIKKCSRRASGPVALSNVFRYCIRKVADDQLRKTVGHDLLVGVLFPSAVLSSRTVLLTPTLPDGYRAGLILGGAPPVEGQPFSLPEQSPVFWNIPANGIVRMLESPMVACPSQGAVSLRFTPA